MEGGGGWNTGEPESALSSAGDSYGRPEAPPPAPRLGSGKGKVGRGRELPPLATSAPRSWRAGWSLCGPCPWRLAAGWRWGGPGWGTDVFRVCAPQGLRVDLRGRTGWDLSLSFLSGIRSQPQAVGGSRGGSGSSTVHQIWKVDQRGWATAGLWGKRFLGRTSASFLRRH